MNAVISDFINQRKLEAEESPVPIDNSGFPEELHQFITNLLNQESQKYFTEVNPDIDKPKVQIKVDMIALADSDDWERYKNLEHIQVTDTVDVYVKKFDADVEITIQSIVYDSIGERVISITAGSARQNLVQDTNKPFVDKVKQLEEYISGMENGVYNSIGRTADGQSRRFDGYTEPPDDLSSDGDIWFKELGDGNVEIYMYSKGVWEPKVTGAEVIDRLVALGIDANEVNIVNLNASNITSGDLEISNSLRITHNGVPVMEVDANTGKIKITAPNLTTVDDAENFEGRNLIREPYSTKWEDVATNEFSYNMVYEGLERNQTYTLSFEAELSGTGDISVITVYPYLASGQSMEYIHMPYTPGERMKTTFTTDDLYDYNLLVYFGRAGSTFENAIIVNNMKLEKGRIDTPWSLAPEDVQSQIDDKAENVDLDNLSEIVSDIGSQVGQKADAGELQQLIDEYNARLEQDIADKEQLAADLATLEGRTTLIETLAGDSKLVTQFIETIITESEEGVFIGNRTNKTGILISDTRISFLDNDTEVAYISNQTMQINHGIFVESAIISDFKFEKIPGTEILAITWVGE